MPKLTRKKSFGRRSADAERKACKRKNETPEDSERRRSSNATRTTAARANETPVETECRRRNNATRMTAARASMCAEEKLEKSKEASLRRMRSTVQAHSLGEQPVNKNMTLEETLFENNMMDVEWQSCNVCQKSLMGTRKKQCGKRCAHFSAQNDMDPGPVPPPPQLADLTYVEQQLIARVHPVVSVYRIKGQQIGYSGHVINFPQEVKEFAALLPHRIKDLPGVLAIRVATEGPQEYTDFHVRAARVREALLWLRDNNRFYSDIVVSEENLSLLPDNGNVFDQLTQTTDILSSCHEDPDGQIETTCVPMFKLPHQDVQVLAALDWPAMGHQPIDEFNTPGYIAQAFPALFPTGRADFGNPRLHKVSAVDYFKHLLQYHDRRFADDPRFRFFALNSTMRWTALANGKLFVRHNEELRGKTVIELRQLVASCPSLVKKIMCYGTKLRGTRAYWRARLAELLDMESQLGLPTLFMTLSAADLHWPDLLRLMETGLSDEEIQSMSDSDRRQLLADRPIVSSDFFFERTEFFMDKIFKNRFGVVDFWRRYEWQHRGSTEAALTSTCCSGCPTLLALPALIT